MVQVGKTEVAPVGLGAHRCRLPLIQSWSRHDLDIGASFAGDVDEHSSRYAHVAEHLAAPAARASACSPRSNGGHGACDGRRPTQRDRSGSQTRLRAALGRGRRDSNNWLHPAASRGLRCRSTRRAGVVASKVSPAPLGPGWANWGCRPACEQDRSEDLRFGRFIWSARAAWFFATRPSIIFSAEVDAREQLG